MSPPIRGSVAKPLLVAFTPCPNCMNSGRKATALRNDMDEKKPAMLAQVKTLLWNSSRCSIGSARRRPPPPPHHDQRAQCDGEDGKQADHLRRAPGIFLPAESQRQQQRHESSD